MADRAFSSCIPFFVVILIAIVLLTDGVGALLSERKVYIVYMGDTPKDVSSIESLHAGMLEQVLGSGASENLQHSYKKSFNGFAAKLSTEEAKKMAGMDGVVSVFPSKQKKLHTTKSWDFLRFPRNVRRTRVESDVIVGMLDTGIWPESDSFSDEGFDPPPKRWKGTCQSSSNFTCNNKIIGARYFHIDGEVGKDDIASPRDSEGHGSHTASTAAGNQVSGASLYGLANGTARGGVPSARIAVYKICWSDGCSDADILAAFDDAIADGVDIISISVGGFFAVDYFEDSIAIGSFHAMKNGILTSTSAGNSGPGTSTVVNVSPWSLIVAAATIDRRFVAELKLGNGQTYEGVAVNTFNLKDRLYPLVYGGNVPNISAGVEGSESRFCGPDTLDSKLVKGKIVKCDGLSDASGPLLAGALGTIMDTYGYRDYAFSYPLPATLLGFQDGGNVTQYINTTSDPKANIMKSEELSDPEAPYVVSFSSRGPHPLTRDLLKPDLAAPGVDILAAWSPIASMSVYDGDQRSVHYNIISGTSMSCPHATGAAAYVKSFHPAWSPAAIRSALMTTAVPMKVSTNTDAEFAYGAGLINPTKAVNPGLVYDAGEADYVSMLCGQGYNTTLLRKVTGDSSTCSRANNGTVWGLNYPSMALSVDIGVPFSASFHRTVTNVGSPKSIYQANVSSPSELKISVEPAVLSFGSQQQKQSFVVNVSGEIKESVVSASLVWSDGVHQVRSPIVVVSNTF